MSASLADLRARHEALQDDLDDAHGEVSGLEDDLRDAHAAVDRLEADLKAVRAEMQKVAPQALASDAARSVLPEGRLRPGVVVWTHDGVRRTVSAADLLGPQDGAEEDPWSWWEDAEQRLLWPVEAVAAVARTARGGIVHNVRGAAA